MGELPAPAPDNPETALRGKISGDDFSCVAGKTAMTRGTLVHRHYGELAAPTVTAALHEDLVAFAERKDEIDRLFASFAATFAGPPNLDEQRFERLLWSQLQQLHDRDVSRYRYSELVSPDPRSPRFGFSVGGHPFFVVGLHPAASRRSRQFPDPTLVFNSHVQFERLRERGLYVRIQREVRRRELALQGSINPTLSDFGESSEARQYSGRAVEEDWRCPFEPSVAGPTAQVEELAP